MKLVVFILVLVPTILSAEEFQTNSPTKWIEEISQRMYKHYEVDDTINNYLLSKIKNGVSIIGPADTSNSDKRFPKRKQFKQKVVLKNKNKMLWKFAPNQSFTINPSKLNNGVTFKTNNKWIKVNQDSVYTGVSITW